MDATVWDNKALPLPNPTSYFIFNFSIISFIFIENKCLTDVTWDMKREKKVNLNPSRSGQKWLHHWSWCLTVVFCSVHHPNHTLVGRVSVHSLCQQDRLFALSVNRHSCKYIYFLNIYICVCDIYIYIINIHSTHIFYVNTNFYLDPINRD